MLTFQVLIFGQSETPVINSGTNTNQIGTKNTFEINATEKNDLQDTTQIELQDKKSKAVILNKKELEKMPKITKESEKKEEKTKSLEAVGSSFTRSKIAASTQTTQRSPSLSQQKEMIEVVNDYEKNAPNSFEYHYFKYVSGNYNVNLISHLLEAQKLKPKNVDVQVQLVAYNYIKNEEKNLKENLEFLLKSEKIDKELLFYAEDLLESVAQNGVLLTHGFDDTYSALYVQKVLKKRSDVKIISLDFLQGDYYKNSLQSSGFILPNESVIDVNYLKDFCIKNEPKSLHLSMTFPKPYLKEISSQLSISGLSFFYSNSTTELESENLGFYEKFNKKQLNSLSSEKVKRITSNYLPFLLSMKSYFELKKDKENLKEVNSLIEKVLVQSKKSL
jgi:hypothetical protein